MSQLGDTHTLSNQKTKQFAEECLIYPGRAAYLSSSRTLSINNEYTSSLADGHRGRFRLCPRSFGDPASDVASALTQEVKLTTAGEQGRRSAQTFLFADTWLAPHTSAGTENQVGRTALEGDSENSAPHTRQRSVLIGPGLTSEVGEALGNDIWKFCGSESCGRQKVRDLNKICSFMLCWTTSGQSLL